MQQMAPSTTSGSPKITCQDVTKSYVRAGQGESEVLSHIDLDVEPGEFVCLLGPSGCGKTTLLNCIAGFTHPDSGSVYMGSAQVERPSPERGVVFQEHALLPWYTVRRNVELGPYLRKADRSERRRISDRYLKLVGLDGSAEQFPYQLSGGMKQRVGIARTLANSPSILLMDEPFAALDAMTRRDLQVELLNIWSQEQKSVVFVTHSIEEAIFLADRIVVMSRMPGRVALELVVDIPRMRDRGSDDFTRVYRQVDHAVQQVVENSRAK